MSKRAARARVLVVALALLGVGVATACGGLPGRSTSDGTTGR